MNKKKVYILHQGKYKRLVLKGETEKAYFVWFEKFGESFSMWVPKVIWENRDKFYKSGELTLFKVPKFIKIKNCKSKR